MHSMDTKSMQDLAEELASVILQPEAFHVFSVILRFPGLREKDVL